MMMMMTMIVIVVVVLMAQEELEREWNKSPTNGTIFEENDDYSDGGETVYPDRQVDCDVISQDDDEADDADERTFRDYDDVDDTAAIKIQSSYRGYRTRQHLSCRHH